MFGEWMGDERIILNDSSCKYCNADYYEPINNTVDYSGLEISLNCKGATIRVRAYMFKELFETQDIVNINYCPMCR